MKGRSSRSCAHAKQHGKQVKENVSTIDSPPVAGRTQGYAPQHQALGVWYSLRPDNALLRVTKKVHVDLEDLDRLALVPEGEGRRRRRYCRSSRIL